MASALERIDDERQRAFRKAVGVSCLAHGALMLLLLASPNFSDGPSGLPGVMKVDLVAAPPGPGSRAAPPPAPAPPVAKPEPEPVPLPEPAPVPPPPPVVDEVVIPEEVRKIAEPKPKPPEPVAKPKPEPEPKPVVPAKPPEPIAYDDALAQLRAEAGEEITYDDAMARLRAEAGAPTQTAALGPPGDGGSGGAISAEEAAWRRKAKIHVTRAWVLEPGMRRQPLVTQVRVKLGATGKVLDVDVVDRSGNPWFDDSVVRAIEKASPLPPPPEAASWRFEFAPQDLL